MKKTARQLAFEILYRIENDGSYSNLLLDEALRASDFDTRDKAFVSNLVYGVIERKITIDYQLKQYLNKPLKKLKPQVLIIMRIGVYQLLFMDKVPQSAAVNESVKLSKNNKCAFASSLINAVLRKCADAGIMLPDEESEEYLSVKYSCPNWLIHKWRCEYGEENAKELAGACIQKAETVVRVNTLRTTACKLKKLFEAEQITAIDGKIENSLIISLSGSEIRQLSSYKNGLFHVQDTSSQLCAMALDAKEGDTVFDLCSAPGGKAFTAAQHMNNCGSLLAFDLYEHRAKLIADSAKRLGIDIISACAFDAEIFNDKIGMADRVLCDVPCSGLGIIRRKPEIKYKSRESLEEIPDIQLRILQNGAKYVKSGGRLIYSTCTLSKAENEAVCEKFLQLNKSFRPAAVLKGKIEESFITLMPQIHSCDGFFIAAFERID